VRAERREDVRADRAVASRDRVRARSRWEIGGDAMTRVRVRRRRFVAVAVRDDDLEHDVVSTLTLTLT